MSKGYREPLEVSLLAYRAELFSLLPHRLASLDVVLRAPSLSPLSLRLFQLFLARRITSDE